jgi:excisionase family DNA binding protein
VVTGKPAGPGERLLRPELGTTGLLYQGNLHGWFTLHFEAQSSQAPTKLLGAHPERQDVFPVMAPQSTAPITSEQKVDTTQLLDVAGAGKFLGLTSWQIRGLLASGEIRCIRVGRKIYFRRATLVRWVEISEGRYKAA